MGNDTFLFPNVTSLPGQTGISQGDRLPKKQEGIPGEFDQIFDRTVKDTGNPSIDLNQIRNPLKFSAHASQRLRDRKISLDPQTIEKVNDAINKADAKGIDDTLVLTKDAALIVNVKNRTVVTAMDRNTAAGNVFTNIDGAVII